jgi:membrane-bound lytic murein transglycosylase D
MPGTAKRYMRVDSLVDERLDPYTATDAAANLMLYNYRLVGTWPLAVTAYNHGPGGLRSIQDELGTSDIAVIVKRYRGRTFGFASRNFYVAFLAALEVDRNAERYFGPITRLPDTESTPVELPDYISVDALAKAFKVDMGALRVLNPALRPPIWNGSRLVPRGYTLRLPGSEPASEIAAGWARLPPAQRYLAQRNDGSHRMRKGETLAGIAAASGMSLSRLLAANGWSSASAAVRGTIVHIPMPTSRADTGATAARVAGNSDSGDSAASAEPVTSLPAPLADAVPPPVAAARKPAPPHREPVSERQTNENALLPVASPTGGWSCRRPRRSDTSRIGPRPMSKLCARSTSCAGTPESPRAAGSSSICRRSRRRSSWPRAATIIASCRRVSSPRTASRVRKLTS